VTITEVDKLCQSQVGMTAAYRAGLLLQENGWMRFPPACWDKPAILALEGERCIAGINCSEDLDDGVFAVHFAWCTEPQALAVLLLRLRQKLRNTACTNLTFTYHEGNVAMARIARLLNAVPHSHTYRMPLGSGGQR